MKTEKLNELEDVIGDFVGISKFKLYNSYVGKEKWYSNLYKKNQKNLKLNTEMLNKIYNTEYVQHFYSNDEIEAKINEFQNS